MLNEKIKEIVQEIKKLEPSEKIEVLNEVKLALHEISPFKKEPVDCVIWVKNEEVVSNDYNPNSVAPPEMHLLQTSIESDGYTQPIVSWKRENKFEVVDGFHRSRVGKEFKTVKNRVKGYLPLTIINSETSERNDRIASTIRHNRARGKHSVDAMSDIVNELKRRNWSVSKISKSLGMDADEILRLCQISGLTELFQDSDFSKAWDLDLNDTSIETELEEIFEED